MEYTKYEQARIIGSRALQISQGAPFMIKIGYNPVEIAKMEFEQDLIPITVKKQEPQKETEK